LPPPLKTAYAQYLATIYHNESPMVDYRGKKRLTPKDVFAEITSLQQTALSPTQLQILEQLVQYLMANLNH